MATVFWIIILSGGLMLVSEIFFRYYVLENAAAKKELNSYMLCKLGLLPRYTTLVVGLVSLLLITVLITAASNLRAAKKSIGNFGVAERVAGVGMICDQLQEIEIDVRRFDQAMNRGARVDSLTENVRVFLEKYEIESVLSITRINDRKQGWCELKYEFGRAVDPTGIELGIFYVKDDKRNSLDGSNYSIDKKILAVNSVGQLAMRINDEVFTNGRATIVIHYTMPRLDPLEPIAYYYINPRDYGEDSLSARLDFDFGSLSVDEPRIAGFNKMEQKLYIPQRVVPPFFSAYSRKGGYGLRTMGKRLSEPVVLLFELNAFPDKLIAAKYESFLREE